ncbi:MAG: leucine-rich repeat domain-containing protein [Bacteroidales bacterium]|nr:leucine-rich repeat domain-containing protein [Bacteroidales bacterium]
MKKQISCILFILFSLSTQAQQTLVDSISYILNQDGVSASVSYCDNNKTGRVVIPDSVKIDSVNYPVTAIDEWAFYKSNISSVSIPKGIADIYTNAFSCCPKLSQFIVAEGNPSYSSIDGVLYSMDKKTLVAYPAAKGAEYVIPEGVTIVGRGAFAYDTLITSVTIPESVTKLTRGAFYECHALNAVNIPSEVTEIEQSVFYECQSLTSLAIPQGVTSIGPYAFYGCSSLTSLIIPQGVTSIAYEAFAFCTGLVSMTIPSGVKLIDEDLFYECSGLTSVSIPDSVTSIGSYAFSGCKALTSIELPDSLTTIGEYAFFECKSLNSIFIPASVTYIGVDAFTDCKALIKFGVAEDNIFFSSVSGVLFSKNKDTLLVYPNAKATMYDIPDGTKAIKNEAFVRCVNLATVSLPATLTSVGDFAFSGCDALTQFVVANENSFFSTVDGVLFSKNEDTLRAYPNAKATNYDIPTGTTAIGKTAFCEMNSLTAVHIPSTVVWIGEGAFAYSKLLSSVNLPSGITSLEVATFFDCSGLKEMVIPSSVTLIGGLSFYGCSSLASIDIPEGVTTIMYGALYECSALTSLVIPASVDSIEEAAFYDCMGLKEVHVRRMEPVTVDEYLFGNLDYDSCTLYVRTGSKAAYDSAYVWNWFGRIIEESVVSVKGTESNLFSVRTEDGSVIVKGVLEGESISVYSLNGVLVKKVPATDNEQRIALPTGAIYLVKVRNQVMKIRIL